MKKNIIIKENISNNFYDKKLQKKNKSFLLKILSQIEKDINKKKNIFHLLSKKYFFNFKKSNLKKFKKFKSIVIIGMGGSILGSKAIYSFLENRIKKEVIFLDNLDGYKLKKILHNKNLRKKLFIIISKSGNTLETLTNISFLGKKCFSSSNTILITENKNSSLKIFSKDMKIPIIEHKKYIVGRYSVLSEVGMVPAYLMGLNVNKFRKNLLKFFKKNNKQLLCDSASKISQNYLSKKISSIIFLNYCPKLNNLVYWCQQLMAESLGKKGKGILPVLSTAPKDHHSLLQLYLDGPKDKMFYIISGKSMYDKKINKKLSKIIFSQRDAFIEVLNKKKISYREIYINDFTESSIGEIFSYFMLETIMISKLINVNPFNQPAVEEVKNLTKKFLN
jgi:glucose-6-phosphate isomerase